MKFSILAPALVALAVLSSCESSTSSSSVALPGSPDPALAGTWRTVEYSANSYTDTHTIVLSASGSLTSVSHNIEWFNGAVDWEHRCTYTGTWSVSGSKLYSAVGGTCSETTDGETVPHNIPTEIDTAEYIHQGSTLRLIHVEDGDFDTTILTRI